MPVEMFLAQTQLFKVKSKSSLPILFMLSHFLHVATVNSLGTMRYILCLYVGINICIL